MGKVKSTVFELLAWLGKAIEAMGLTTDSADTVSIALCKFLCGCITLLSGALRKGGTSRIFSPSPDTLVGVLILLRCNDAQSRLDVS